MKKGKDRMFTGANIMLPKEFVDMKKWSVVACDQYTSERDYWANVKQYVGDEYSTLNMVFPEMYLEDEGFEDRIKDISLSMKRYIEKEIFITHENSLIYVRRVLANNTVRHGIVGKIDLEDYSYTKGIKSPIRATEGTVLERIPPRVKVRQECPLESPHVMLLIDDENCEIIESIADKAESLEKVYDFSLMQESGSISGYLLDEECVKILDSGIEHLMNPEYFEKRYGVKNESVLTFAVGDGNHSLATAKTCYENLKKQIGEKALESEARFALVELVNLHDESLEFEAIHRCIFEVKADHLKEKMSEFFEPQISNRLEENDFVLVTKEGRIGYKIKNPLSNLAVGDVQDFMDGYLKTYGGRIDYIHGESIVEKLCEEEEALGILLNCMEKSDLFKTVILDGALPRKTFSMGEACDKRFYLEVRTI